MIWFFQHTCLNKISQATTSGEGYRSGKGYRKKETSELKVHSGILRLFILNTVGLTTLKRMQIGVAYSNLVDKILSLLDKVKKREKYIEIPISEEYGEFFSDHTASIPVFRVKPEITFVLDNVTILFSNVCSPCCPDLSFPEFYFNWIIIIVLEKPN